jgi:hypothetical protein
MRSKAALRILVFLLAAFPSVVLAQRFVVQRLCFARELVPPPLKPFPIPVGCEIIDCCPGCPEVGPLDWRIQIDGRVLQGAVLKFEGMDAAELKRVKISGNPRLVGDGILLQRGISMISALPASGSDRVRVGSLAPEFDKAAATRLESAAQISKRGGGDADAAADQDNIVVQQLLGSVAVNVFHWRSLVGSNASTSTIGPLEPPNCGEPDCATVDDVARIGG